MARLSAEAGSRHSLHTVLDVRVLQFTESSSAGVGRHILDLAEGLVRLGCDLHLVYGTRRMDAAFSERLNALRRVALAPLNVGRSIGPRDLLAVVQLRRYIRRHGPFDILHAHSSKAGALARLVPRGGACARVVYTPHCMYTMNPAAPRAVFHGVRIIELALALRADAIIAVSPDERRHMRRLGLPSRKLRVITNGILPLVVAERRHARRQLGLPQEEVLIAFLGRLSAQKDPLFLVEAFADLCRRAAQVRLAVAGDGPLLAAAQRLAAALGAAPRISWLGYQPAATVLSAADMLALCSRYEGMPYVLLEALSAGLPVVTCDEIGRAHV